jgi:hypothetical protein
VRLSLVGPPRNALASAIPRVADGLPAEASRPADFGREHGTIDTPVRSRASIGAEPVSGPLLIDEYDTTIVVPPDWKVRLHESGALVLDRIPRAADPVQLRKAGSDPVTRQIVANGLGTVADEMATTIFRTAHSTVVRDAMDFSAALCSATGETVAQAVTIPLQLGSIPNVIKVMFERLETTFDPATSTSSTIPSTARATRRTSSSSSRCSSKTRGSASQSPLRITATSAAECPGRSPVTAPTCSRKDYGSPGFDCTKGALRSRRSSSSSRPTAGSLARSSAI